METAFTEETTTRIISDIGLIELFSSFARRVRMQEISTVINPESPPSDAER